MVGGGPEGSNCASGMVASSRTPPLQPAATRATTVKTTRVATVRRSDGVSCIYHLPGGRHGPSGLLHSTPNTAESLVAAARVYRSSKTPSPPPRRPAAAGTPTPRRHAPRRAGRLEGGLSRFRRNRGMTPSVASAHTFAARHRNDRSGQGGVARLARVACGGASRSLPARLGRRLGFLPYTARNERSGQGGLVSTARWRRRRLGGSVTLIWWRCWRS